VKPLVEARVLWKGQFLWRKKKVIRREKKSMILALIPN